MDELISYAFWNNKGGVGKTTLAFQLSTAYALAHPDENVLCIDVCPQANFSSSLLSCLQPNAVADAEILLEGSTVVQKLEHTVVPIRNAEGDLMMRVPQNIAGLFKLRLNQLKKFPELSVHVADYNNNLSDNMYLLCGSSALDLFSRKLAFESTTNWDSVHTILRDFVHHWYLSHGRKKTVAFIDTNPALTAYTEVALCAADRLLVPVNADDYSRQALQNLVQQVYPQPDNAYDSLLEEFINQTFGYRLQDSREVPRPRIHCIIDNRGSTYAARSAAVFGRLVRNLYRAAYEFYLRNGDSMFTSVQNARQQVAAEFNRLHIDDNENNGDDPAFREWMWQYTFAIPDGHSSAIASARCGISARLLLHHRDAVKRALNLKTALRQEQCTTLIKSVDGMLEFLERG